MESRNSDLNCGLCCLEEEALAEVEVTKENGSKVLLKKFKKCSDYA